MYCDNWKQLLQTAARCTEATPPSECPRYGFYSIDKATNEGVLLTSVKVSEDAVDASFCASPKWCEVWLGDNPVLKVNLTRDEIDDHIINATEILGSPKRSSSKFYSIALLIDLVGMGVTVKYVYYDDLVVLHLC